MSKICQACGKTHEAAKTCPYCGAAVPPPPVPEVIVQIPEDKRTCSICGKTHQAAKICPYCGVAVPPPPIKNVNPDVMVQMQEYKRTCRNCGKIWHSLVSREGQLSYKATTNQIGACGSNMRYASTCFMCGGSRAAQMDRNTDAIKSELDRLKTCPDCGSKNYSEDLLTYGR